MTSKASKHSQKPGQGSSKATSVQPLDDVLLDELVLLLAKMAAREALADQRSGPKGTIATVEPDAGRSHATRPETVRTQKPKPRARAPPQR